MSNASAEELSLTNRDEYTSRGAELLLSTRVDSIDRPRRHVLTARGERVPYDVLVLATGARPFVPPIEGTNKRGVFVYRTLEDLDQIREYAARCSSAVVLGGGLLGLEAAKALLDLGLSAHVVEAAPRLMPRQLDDRGGDLLRRNIEALGVRVHLGRQTTRITGSRSAAGLLFDDGKELLADLVVISAGIRPRDELARHAGLQVGGRGGICVDDQLRTSDPRIFAIGECALHRGELYGLVGPGYAMADALASVLLGEEAHFGGADTSTKLKLLGVDVASFGDPFAQGRELVMQDWLRGVYKKLVISEDGKHLLGGMLVGDVSDYSHFVHLCKSQQALSAAPEELIFGRRGETPGLSLPDSAQVCSCNNVSKGDICVAVREGNTTLLELKQCTRAGTGCGGCVPLVSDLIEAELLQAGGKVKRELCEHFPFSRQELFEIVRVEAIRTFEELIARFGRGHGCEVCRPVVASIYGACFGVELTINNVAAMYFVDDFQLDLKTAGVVAGLFGLMNLFARALGGLFGDRIGLSFGLRGRVALLGALIACEGVSLLVFSRMHSLGIAIVTLIVFSLFVQMSEGATFSVVPFVNPRALGSVSGIVGAGGNAGAVAAGFLFRSESISTSSAFSILGGVVIGASLLSLLVRFSQSDESVAREEILRRLETGQGAVSAAE